MKFLKSLKRRYAYGIPNHIIVGVLLMFLADLVLAAIIVLVQDGIWRGAGIAW